MHSMFFRHVYCLLKNGKLIPIMEYRRAGKGIFTGFAIESRFRIACRQLHRSRRFSGGQLAARIVSMMFRSAE